jgi:hypothetical protein
MADRNVLYDLLEQSSLYSGTRRMYSYQKSNPVEAAAVEQYWRSGGARPVAATKFGQFLLDTADSLGSSAPAPAGSSFGDGTFGSDTFGG